MWEKFETLFFGNCCSLGSQNWLVHSFKLVNINGHAHSLTLSKGHSAIKIKPFFSETVVSF